MFLTISKYCHKPSGGKILLFSLLACYIIVSSSAFDDDDDDVTTTPTHNQENLPKDKILLKSIKTLTFHRNKRTTSRRTHSIHQLSCVGGTAGCKLFTPNVSIKVCYFLSLVSAADQQQLNLSTFRLSSVKMRDSLKARSSLTGDVTRMSAIESSSIT